MQRLTLTHTADESPTVRTFYFAPEHPLDYQPGQFIELHIPHTDADSKGERRWFTLSSSPTERHVAVTVKRPPEPQPASTFKRSLWQLSPGETVRASDPLGDFVLPLNTATPLVWIAGGIGITPFRSQAVWLAEAIDSAGNSQATRNQTPRPIYFIHSTSGSHEQIFDHHIQRLPLAGFRRIDTSQQPRITAEEVLSAISELGWHWQSDAITNPPLFYIAGPEPMANALARDLQLHGIGRNSIITDAFLGYGL